MANQTQIDKLQAQLDAIDEAVIDIASGGAKVVVGDREYQAADLDDLRKLRNDVAGALQSLKSGMFRRVTFGRVS